MARLTESDFKKMLSDGNFGGIYMIYGDEKYLVSRYTTALIEKVAGKEPSDFAFHTFKSYDDVEKISDAASMMPFTADYNCVYICDADVDSVNAKQQEDILYVLNGVKDNSVIIISQQGITPKDSGFQKKLVSFCEKNGVTLNLAKKTDADLKKYIVKWAEKSGCSISTQNAAYMLSVCIHDLNSIKNELAKLCSYAGEREITKEDIDLLVTKNQEYRIFQLADAVQNGNAEEAFKQLDFLFYQKERPEVILSVLGTAYIDMYRTRVAIENGYKSAELTQYFNYKGKEFRLSKAERASKGMSTNALRYMLNLLFEADRKIKSTPADNRTVLESLVTSLILARNRV